MSFQTINPTTDEALQNYTHHSLNEALEKIRLFSHGQKKWQSFSVEKRAEVLKKIAQKLRENKAQGAELAALEMGKPITQGLAEIEKCAVALETLGQIALENLKAKEIQAHYKKTILRPEAYGLVFSVQPWNFPFWQALRMSACAWMAGNLVVLKHSDSVAACAEWIENITHNEEVPLLLNLRLNHETAAQVIESPLIHLVTFTGSTRGGKSVARTAGGALKKAILELGGSDAYIVMPDCDLELAVKTCVQARLINSGQSCIAGKRFFIHEQIFDSFKKRFKALLAEKKVGNPLEPQIEVGPLASKKFLNDLGEQIARAEKAGAKLEWADLKVPEMGSFTKLGILDFGSDLKAFEKEEIFAPIASLYQFKDLAQVIETINEGIYGLGGGIFTRDLDLAQKTAEQIQTGTFTINSFTKSDARVPFGGVKESGMGREMGLQGLQDFVSWKVVGHG